MHDVLLFIHRKPSSTGTRRCLPGVPSTETVLRIYSTLILTTWVLTRRSNMLAAACCRLAWSTVYCYPHSFIFFSLCFGWHRQMVSGVYYVKTPPGSGAIQFLDPRGPYPPFDDKLTIRPRAGDLLLFPSWLQHQVMSRQTAKAAFYHNRGYVDRLNLSSSPSMKQAGTLSVHP